MTIKQAIEMISPLKVMEVLTKNEVGSDLSKIYRFSDAGGKSGYSFGRSQFDVSNNKNAELFLKNRCGFTDNDIQRLNDKDPNIEDLNGKLSLHKKEIDMFDLEHIKEMMSYIEKLPNMPEVDNVKTFLQILDYNNQFHISLNGPMHRFLQSLKKVTSKDILDFKMGLKWGKERPDDVLRRYRNIEESSI